ncbi:MAG TPA: Txe/YoeB family addiction module toxin [Devosiaceae bacterium]|nr:Txe/YoeB family addiction module toxin [Devosiaceae bacterium]
MRRLFTEKAWADYLYWQEHDPKLLDRINALLKDCSRSPFSGVGKPEPLRENLAGWWSRRINDEQRLVYRIEGESLVIAQCRYHYSR